MLISLELKMPDSRENTEIKKLSRLRQLFGGAGYETRTRDFHLGKVTLYH